MVNKSCVKMGTSKYAVDTVLFQTAISCLQMSRVLTGFSSVQFRDLKRAFVLRPKQLRLQ